MLIQDHLRVQRRNPGVTATLLMHQGFLGRRLHSHLGVISQVKWWDHDMGISILVGNILELLMDPNAIRRDPTLSTEVMMQWTAPNLKTTDHTFLTRVMTVLAIVIRHSLLNHNSMATIILTRGFRNLDTKRSPRNRANNKWCYYLIVSFFFSPPTSFTKLWNCLDVLKLLLKVGVRRKKTSFIIQTIAANLFPLYCNGRVLVGYFKGSRAHAN